MSTAADFRRIARSLDGTSETAHFDRAAFKVARIYATLAADGRTANLKFAPDEQEMKCLLAPEAFAAVPNAWGQQGWTAVTLFKVTAAELRHAREIAWRHALPKKPLPKKPLPKKHSIRRKSSHSMQRKSSRRR